jgi:hypothetical protein
MSLYGLRHHADYVMYWEVRLLANPCGASKGSLQSEPRLLFTFSDATAKP